jgi:hypothetical protein
MRKDITIAAAMLGTLHMMRKILHAPKFRSKYGI